MKKVLLSLAVSILMGTNGFTQHFTYDHNPADAGFSVEQADEQNIQLSYTIYEWSMSDMNVNRESVKKVELPGHFLPNDEGAPDSMPMPFDADLLGAFDLLQIVHQQFTDLEAAKKQLKMNEDARGVAVVADLILKHADKIAPTHGQDVALEPSDLIRPLTEKLLLLAEKHPAIKDDLTDLLLEIEQC